MLEDIQPQASEAYHRLPGQLTGGRALLGPTGALPDKLHVSGCSSRARTECTTSPLPIPRTTLVRRRRATPVTIRHPSTPALPHHHPAPRKWRTATPVRFSGQENKQCRQQDREGQRDRSRGWIQGPGRPRGTRPSFSKGPPSASRPHKRERDQPNRSSGHRSSPSSEQKLSRADSPLRPVAAIHLHTNSQSLAASSPRE